MGIAILIAIKKVMDLNAKQVKAGAAGFSLAAWLSGIIDYCITGVFSTIKGLFDGLDITSFRNVSFGTSDSIGYVNAVFPLSEFVTLCVLYLTAWGTIILFRWVKSLIPTVAN